MSLRAQVSGMIAEPVLRYTGKQQAVLEIRINATASVRDPNSGQWSDLGAPLWVSAQFWEERAEALSQQLQKGNRITVEGTLVVENYQRRDGGTGTGYKLHRPRFLGVIPTSQGTSPREGATDSYRSPSSYQPPHENEAPF